MFMLLSFFFRRNLFHHQRNNASMQDVASLVGYVRREVCMRMEKFVVFAKKKRHKKNENFLTERKQPLRDCVKLFDIAKRLRKL